MELTVGGRSEQGQRTNNEDHLHWWPELGLFVVADGMGGHNAGEVASHLAVEVIHEFIAESAASSKITWPFGLEASHSLELNRLTTAVRLANRRVFANSETDAALTGMGTTVVAALVAGNRVALVSVGDSRIYRWRQGALEQLTRDDTWLASVLGSQEADAQSGTHPLRHVLTSVVGTADDVQPGAREEIILSGDTFVMCTDGVHGQLDVAAMTGVLAEDGSAPERAAHVVEEALAQGTSDNATALVFTLV